MLSNDDVLWLLNAAKRWRNTMSGELRDDVSAHITRIETEFEKPEEQLELLIHCPRCLKQHIDEGRFAKEAHKIHACQFCGLGFVVSKQPSIGVQFFDGWKNPEGVTATPSGKPPTVTAPAGYSLTPVGCLHAGATVRFKEEAASLGYDVSKTYKIESVTTQLSVRLEGDTLPVSYSLLEPVPPG